MVGDRALAHGPGLQLASGLSAVGHQRPGVVLSTTLGHPALRAYARGSVLPSVYMGGDTSGALLSSSGQSPCLRLASEVGLRIAPERVRVEVTARYRFERYDFTSGSVLRLEQMDAVGLAVGYRIGR